MVATVANLDAILLTHIHLDHAGGTGALVRENPLLKVYVHSRGATHMQDPSKLLASATRLWGSELPRLYGETLPVPAENLRILEGGETLALGARKLEVVYTPGHASHHVSYFDHEEGTAFVGDTAGIRIDNGPYILPATPPPDINLELWDASFDAILERRPARLFVTHFGYAQNPSAHIAQFRETLHRWSEIAAHNLRQRPNEIAASEGFVKTVRAELVSAVPEGMADPYAFTAGMDLSFLGLARVLPAQTRGCARVASVKPRKKITLVFSGLGRRLRRRNFRGICVRIGRLDGRFNRYFGRYLGGCLRHTGRLRRFRFGGWIGNRGLGGFLRGRLFRRYGCRHGSFLWNCLGSWRRIFRGNPRGQNIHQQVYQFLCATAVRIFVGVVLCNVQREQVLVLNNFLQDGASVAEGQPSVARNVYTRQLGGVKHIGVEMDDEFARIRMQLGQRVLRGLVRALQGYVRQVNMAHGRTRQKFLFRRVEAFEAKKQHVRLAYQRSIAPEARQFRRTLADDVGDHHAIDTARRRGGGRIQIGVAIEPQQADIFVVAPRAGQ